MQNREKQLIIYEYKEQYSLFYSIDFSTKLHFKPSKIIVIFHRISFILTINHHFTFIFWTI